MRISAFLTDWPIYSRPGGRSCFFAMAPKAKMQGAIVCDRWREMPDEKVEEGGMGRPHLRRQCRLEGQRRGGALLPREVRVGESQREAVIIRSKMTHFSVCMHAIFTIKVTAARLKAPCQPPSVRSPRPQPCAAFCRACSERSTAHPQLSTKPSAIMVGRSDP